MATFGIDLSKYQKGIDFDRVKAAGVKFVILRGAYHMSKDSCFDSFYSACKERGIHVGVYHYSMAQTVAEARQEAKFLIQKVLCGKQFEFPIWMDVEDRVQRALGKTLLTDIVCAYCDVLEKAGYYVGIYSSKSFFSTELDEFRLQQYDKWIAQWSKRCTYKGEFGLWQFGGESNMIRSNKVAGRVVDQNYAYKDYPTIIKRAGLNGYTAKKTVAQLAQEVLDGKWGTGAARKKALTAAGYNYTAVQEKVNALLK